MYEVWGISIWAFVIIGCLIIEGMSVALVSIWFALGAMAALVVSVFTDSIAIQSSVFLIVSLLTLIFTRPIVKKLIKNGKDNKTNLDLIVGEKALVLEEIDNIREKGSIKIKGNIWTARSESDRIIKKDTLVLIKRIEGVKLIVEEEV